MAEQILIELVLDASQIESAIPTLQKLGKLSGADAKILQNLASNTNKTFEAAAAAAPPVSKSLNDVQKSAVSLANTFEKQVATAIATALSRTGVAASDLKQRIEAVTKTSAFGDLKSRISEVNAQLLETAARMESLRHRGAVDTEGYRNLEKQLEAGKHEAERLAVSLDNVKKSVSLTEPGLSDLAKAQEELKKSLKEVEKLSPFEALQKQISEANKKVLDTAAALQRLKKTGGIDTEQYQKLQNELEQSKVHAASLAQEMEAVKAATDQTKKSTEDLAEVQNTLRIQLREVTEEMAALATNGERNSVKYEELAVKAGVLKKAISDAGKDAKAFGSETPGLDKMLIGLRGVAGLYATGQGAAALFGEENEEVQKTLLKVNAAMTLLAGLKETTDLINSREFASLTTLLGAQKLQTLQTNLQAAAESRNIAMRYAAIVAQKALNAVMAISPLGLIALAVGAIAAAWLIFSKNVAEAAEEQAKLNSALDRSGKFLEMDLKNIDGFNEKYKAILRERGASNDELVKADAAAANKRIKLINDEITAASKALNESKATDEEGLKLKSDLAKKKLDLELQLQDEVRNLEIKSLDFQRKQYEDSLKSYVAFYDSRVAQARKGSIAELQAQMEAVKARAAAEKKLNPNLTAGELFKMAAETTRQLRELSSQITITMLEDQKSLMEAKLATLREGSVEELEERKRIAAKAAEIELSQFDISEQKKTAIRARSVQEQQEFDRQIAELRLQEEANHIAAQIAIARQGSEAEYKLQVESVRKQYEIDLTQKGITDSRKQQLTAEYYRTIENMDREHNRKLTEQAINARQLQINAQLADLNRASTSDNDRRLLELKQLSIDQQAALEKAAAIATITRKSELVSKLYEIDRKAEADKAALDEQSRIRQINFDLEITNLALENAKKRAMVDMETGNFQQRITARREYQRLVIAQIDEEEAAYDRMWEDGLISYEDWNRKILEIQGKRIDAELAAEQEKENRRKELMSAGIGVLQQGLDAVYEIGAANRQAELDDILSKLQKQYDAEINNKTLTEQQKAVLEERYERRAAQIKRTAWLKERQAKISQAIMNGLLAVTNALATAPTIIAGIPLAAAAAATAAINVAKIKSEPIPQFKKGTRRAPKGMALVGEEGPELVQLRGGEKIYTYKQSKKILRDWEGVSQMQAIADSLPVKVDKEIISNSVVNNNGELKIDYDKLGSSMAKHIPKPAIIQNSMDEDGISTFILDRGNKTRIRNKRYRIG